MLLAILLWQSVQVLCNLRPVVFIPIEVPNHYGGRRQSWWRAEGAIPMV